MNPCLCVLVSECYYFQLTWVIFAKFREGRCSWASSGLRRFIAIFLSFSTQGWDLLRDRLPFPAPLLPSSGVESGELLSDASFCWSSVRLICSWERDKGRRKAWLCEWCEKTELGDTEEAVNWRWRGSCWLKSGGSRVPSGAELEHEGKLKLELRCIGGKWLDPPLTLPPLWYLRFSTDVHTLEPWGLQDERDPLNSSENDRERHCRLLGGAAGVWVPLMKCVGVGGVPWELILFPRVRSLIRLVIAVVLPGSLAQCKPPGSGPTSHRLSKLESRAFSWMAQLRPRSNHLSASEINHKQQTQPDWHKQRYEKHNISNTMNFIFYMSNTLNDTVVFKENKALNRLNHVYIGLLFFLMSS